VPSHPARAPQHRRGTPGDAGKRHVGIVFIALMLAVLLAALDQTIVATALPTIVGSLHGVSELAWVTTAYLLTSTVALPIYGKLGDQFGRKGLFVFAIIVFLAGSVLSGLSQDMAELIAFRGLQGVGAGGLMIGAQAIIGDIVSPRERGKYMGFFGAVFGVATVAGPLLGGFLTEHASWRWIFYVNVPIGAIALPIVISVLKLPRHEEKHRLDFLGMLLLSAASVAITLFATWGGSTYSWRSPVIIGLAAGFVALAALFVLAERYAAEPIIPLRLFRNSIFNITGLIGVMVGIAMFGSVSYLGYFLQMVDHVSPTVSGLLMLPFVGGMLVSSILSGQIVTKTGRYKIFPILGTVIAGGGLYLLSRMSISSTRVENGIYMAVLGFGIGLVFQILVVAVQNAASVRDLGSATAANNYLRQIGGTVGSGIVGSLFAARLTSKIHQMLPASASVHAPSGQALTPQILDKMPPAIAHIFTLAYAEALPPIFLYLVPLMGASFVLALFLKEIRLRTTVGIAPEGLEHAVVPAAGTGAPAPVPAGAVTAAGGAAAMNGGPAPVPGGTALPAAGTIPLPARLTLEPDGAALAPRGERKGLVLASVGGDAAREGYAGGRNGQGAYSAAHEAEVPAARSAPPPAAFPGASGGPEGPGAAYLGAPEAAADAYGQDGPGEPGGVPVHGRVRQAAGTPVSDATVTLIDMSGRQAGRSRTNADGSYQVRVPGRGMYTLIAIAGAHQPYAAAVHVSGDPVEHDVLLTGASRLAGTVRAADGGAPIPGATVTLADMHGEVMAARSTDEAGRYLFEELAPGRYTLAVSAHGCQPSALPVTVADGTETTQDAELHGGTRLEGTARSTRGTVVPDARVTLLDSDGNVAAVTTTGTDGRYAFENLPEGDYTVIASGYPPAASRLRITSSQPHSHDVQLGHPEA